jgi:hypothetical protein
MSNIILLDGKPLGLITNPAATQESRDCNAWMQAHLRNGIRVLVSEIIDYEFRRGLLRVGKTADISKLDDLKSIGCFDRLPPDTLLQASSYWAYARRTGQATANDQALDVDVILCAHAKLLADKGHRVVIASDNLKHLRIFADAYLWRNIHSYPTSSGDGVISINKSPTHTSVMCSPATSSAGQRIILRADVVGMSGVPTGDVEFLVNGSSLGVSRLRGGSISIVTLISAAGSYSISASYHGSPDFLSSISSPVTHTVT